MNDDASLNQNVPKDYQNLSRENARKKIIEDMASEGLIAKIDDYINSIGYSERGGVPIEYYLSDQWYMKMDTLAKPALNVVSSGKIKFHPEHWVKTYNHWMENIKDWCISRQLVWGHQIPVWYHNEDSKKIHVSIDGPDDPENWNREKDVLDTWASSWLWSFAVHSWPQKDKNINSFYPADTLVTGPDIIFFWVARMIMAGKKFLEEIPFRNVYFTSILRDKDGKKFSKSLGNSPDPFTLFEEYGTDAVRFSTMLMSPQGLDVLFSEERLEIGRNFMNKLWNASRFVRMNIEKDIINNVEIETDQLQAEERWILNQLNKASYEVNRCLEDFKFNEAAKIIYEFTWNDYCDWFIEIAKTRFYGDDKEKSRVTQIVAVKTLKGILTLLHPYAPFITEEIWSYFSGDEDSDLIISPWLNNQNYTPDQEAIDSIQVLKSIVSSVRMIRSQMNVPSKKYSNIVIRNGKEFESIINDSKKIIQSLSKIDQIIFSDNNKRPEKSATVVSNKMEIFVPLEGLIDFKVESLRLEKRLSELDKHVLAAREKLSNDNFVKRAPKEVVSHEKQKLDDMVVEYNLVKQNLDFLS